jgi:hypothetical protein
VGEYADYEIDRMIGTWREKRRPRYRAQRDPLSARIFKELNDPATADDFPDLDDGA